MMVHIHAIGGKIQKFQKQKFFNQTSKKQRSLLSYITSVNHLERPIFCKARSVLGLLDMAVSWSINQQQVSLVTMVTLGLRSRTDWTSSSHHHGHDGSYRPVCHSSSVITPTWNAGGGVCGSKVSPSPTESNRTFILSVREHCVC